MPGGMFLPLGVPSDDSCGCGGTVGIMQLPLDDCLGSGTGCLAVSQKIVLASGEVKLAGDIQAGDKLLGRNGQDGIREQIVSNLQSFELEIFRVKFTGGEILCTDSHPFYLADGRCMKVPCLEPDDSLASQDTSQVLVESIARIGIGKVVSWECSPDHNFYVGGVLTHNKTAIASADYM